jgi:osmoprotectant transport system ATP-binding protein
MIKVEGLTKVFEPSCSRAVDSVSFELARGEIGAIIGTSGCGKTTTLKMINRLIEPTEGSIWVGNEESRSSNAISWRRRIGYVVQKAGLLPHLTVKRNISLLSEILKRSPAKIEQRVNELLEVVNLPYREFAERYPLELSGGQQQRVGIARALMEDPPVLLMDEPFGALDPITRASLHEEFLQLNRRLKKTILIVTHDLAEAFKLSEKVLLMDGGKIIQVGSRDDFMRRPVSPFVSDFMKGQIHG